jgi:tetratricopeptide (TPR) repeat protein
MASKHYRKKAMIGLLYVYNNEGNYADLTEVAQILLSEPLNAQEKREVLHLLGEAQFNQMLYADALETYNEALRITRKDVDKRALKLQIAKVYLEIGNYEECRNFLAGEDEPEFKNLLADLNVKLNNIETAKEIYLDVAHKSHSLYGAQAYFKLAELYENEDSLEMAITYYDSSISKSSTSEFTAQAKKKSDVLKRIVALTQETEEVDRAQFLLAEIYFVDLNELEQAIEEYQKVYHNYPESEWAAKALYAQFWITKYYFQDDSLSVLLAQDLMTQYPDSEYAMSVERLIQE